MPGHSGLIGLVLAVCVFAVPSPVIAQLSNSTPSSQIRTIENRSAEALGKSQSNVISPFVTGGGGGGAGGGNTGNIGGQDVTKQLAFRSFELPAGDTLGNVRGVTVGGINSNGDIVGSFCSGLGCGTNHGFLLSGGIFTVLDFPGAALTSAQGINDSGEIVGWYWDAALISTHGAIFPNSSFDLCGSGQQTQFFGVSNKGDIAASCGFANGYLLTGQGTFTVTPSMFPNTSEVVLRGVNSVDQYVGYTIDYVSNMHGLTGNPLDGPSQVDYPGAQTTQIVGINDAGQIIGQAFDSQTGHGFVCALPIGSDCFKSFDVTIQGSRQGSTQPTGISSNGELVGQYSDSNGNHGFAALPFTTSYYVLSNKYETLYRLGKDFAKNQLALGFTTLDSIAALLFKAPTFTKGVYGTAGLGGSTPISAIGILAEDFAKGYHDGLGANGTAHVTVVIATSNGTTQCRGSQVSYGHGEAWAQMVNAVTAWVGTQGYSAQVAIAGGSDIEISSDVWGSNTACKAAGKYEWADKDDTLAWVSGYRSVYPQPVFYDVGDAGGCPQHGTTAVPGYCGRGFTQEDLWNISWGSGPSSPLPEIYTKTASQANEWANLSLYGYLAHGSKIAIEGVLTQSGSCGDECEALGNTPSVGWTQLYDKLNGDTRTAQHILLLTDISNSPR